MICADQYCNQIKSIMNLHEQNLEPANPIKLILKTLKTESKK